MARGFGATLGAGTTDGVVTTLTTHSTQRTYSIWAYRRGGGGSGLGRLFDKRVSGVDTEWFYVDVNHNFSRGFSGSASRWFYSTTLVPLDTWHHHLVTYDSSSSANDPVMYLDGVAQSLSVIRGSGTALTNTDGYVLGNRASDNARNWDGILAEWAVWDRLLTDDEVWSLSRGYSPAFFPQSLVSYVPLIRDNIDEILTEPTLTGTAVQPHPPIQYPEPPQMVVLPTSPTVSSFFFRNYVLSRRAG